MELEALWSGRPNGGTKLLPQGGVGPVQTHLDVFLRQMEALRGLFCGHSFDIAQHENHAVVFRNGKEGLLQQATEFPIIGSLFRDSGQER